MDERDRNVKRQGGFPGVESVPEDRSYRDAGGEDGATVTEYAIMMALIVVTCIGTVSALGTKVESVFAFLP